MTPIAIGISCLLLGSIAGILYYHTRVKLIASELTDSVSKLSHTPSNLSSDLNKGVFQSLKAINNQIKNMASKPSKEVLPVDKKEPGENEPALLDIQKKYETLQVVNELGQHVTSSLKLEESFQHLYETINSMMDASVMELGIYNWRDNRWQILSNKKEINNNSEYQNHFAEWSLKNKREVMLGNVEKDYERYVFKPLVLPNGEKPKSLLVFPVYRDKKEVGAISVMSFHENAYNEYHCEMIRSLIPYTAVAIGNSLIHQELIETQGQLIHNEKMASLGQIASGIAHEILNPLNFVNNFSEMSLELVPEIELSQSKEEQTELKTQLLSNLDKIHLHGQRAYSIVKNMLLLSRRNGKGTKSEVKIDQAIEEFLDIAYTGFRNKFPNFQCNIITEFADDSLVYEIIPEDFGSIILNLSSNAFYTLNEKTKKIASMGDQSGLVSFEPTLIIKTYKEGNKLKIDIRDNGMGIPEEIHEKIFLPFFTTKPPGEGTGLGLSISHDIVFKGNKGNLSVSSTLNKGSNFTISLPLSM